MGHFIDDGFTYPFEVEGLPGVCDKIVGRARPALPTSKEELQELCKQARDEVAAGNAQRQFVIDHVVNCNASEKLTIQQLKKLPTFGALFDTIYNNRAADEPDGKPGEQIIQEGN